MNIKVKITRQTNATYYGKQVGDEIEITLHDYLCGVVASEVGNSNIEVCKAQAIAARTFAYPYWNGGKAISDSSSTAQAFRAERITPTAYKNAQDGVTATEGMVLEYNGTIINSCPYSASNGGRIVSSQERWGGVRAWLVSKDDPWDLAATKGVKTGHGVGMSQRGAQYAASIGKTYTEILSFYYPGTNIKNTTKGDEPTMANNTIVNATDLIDKAKYALNNHWGYIWGAHGEMWTQAKQNAATRDNTKKYGARWIGHNVTDCSGLFYWAYKELGGYIYHGSNTMYKSYCTEHGTLVNGCRSDGKDLKPGCAVFMWNTSNGWHHVGMYIGNGRVIEARGTIAGVIESSVSEWSHWGELKNTNYNVAEEPDTTVYPHLGVVTTVSGNLNLRKEANSSSAILLRIPRNETITLNGKFGSFYSTTYNGKSGYVHKDYIVLVDEKEKKVVYTVSCKTMSQENKDKILAFVEALGESAVVEEGDK